MNSLIKNIYLIDDDPVNNMITRIMLRKQNPSFNIQEFIKAEEALSYLKSGKIPDLILLDINMPEMNGWQFLDQFKNLSASPFVIILTSSIDSADYRKAKSYRNVKGYIEKPLTPTKILNLLSTSPVS